MANLKRKRIVEIKFTPPADCGEVKVAGDFTDWEKGAIVMSRSGKSGEWAASMKLAPGEHQYRFLLDGKWYTDSATEHVVSPFGSENSVLRIS